MKIPACVYTPNYRSVPALGDVGPDNEWQRLDPSNVVFWNNRYWITYTKAVAKKNLYTGTVWAAVSDDGVHWTEVGEARDKGQADAWDNFGVITPYMVPWEGKFYLFYTASHEKAGEAWAVRGENNKRHIGVAVADEPQGPYKRIKDTPVLSPGVEGEWDSYLVDDTHILYRNQKFWLYYKGGDKNVTVDTTKWGVAVSDCLTGPYVKYGNNPFLDSGHTVCVWKQGCGVVALVDTAGPQKNTMQYSEDGLHFVKTADVVLGHDIGTAPYDAAAHTETDSAPGVTWGMTAGGITQEEGGIPYLKRFEVDCEQPE